MKTPLHVLIVEDSEDDARLLVHELMRGGYEVTAERVETADAMKNVLSRGGWELVLSDHALPHFNGVAALRILKESTLDIPFIFVSGTIGEDIAVGSMKAGAHDYVMKGNLARLVPAVTRELRDAAERRQHREAQEQLRISEHKYRHLFRSMSDAALLIAEQTDKIIDANEQTELLFGRSREEVLGLTSAQLFPPLRDGQFQKPLAESVWHVSGGCESVVQRKDGTTLPVHLSVSRVQLDGSPFLLMLFCDISRRKQAEEALRTSEERLSKIFHLSPTPICIIRASDNLFVDANENFIEGTGYTRDEIIGHTPMELHLWDDPEERAAIMRKVQETGTAIACKLRGRRKSGEIGVGLSSMTQIALNGENHYLWLIQDITELERAADARRESDQRFRQVTENIDEVFWLTNPAKTEMIYISPAYQCVWGRTCESLYAAPQSWLDEVHPEDRERVLDALKLQSSGTYDLDYRIVRPDGTTRWIHERAFPVKDAEGKAYRIAGVSSDITVRRQLEEQFRQAQKMEVVGQLAGGIAHDFNNLLTIVQIQSSLLLTEPGISREVKEGIQEIMDAARRAANLTRQLLTFSRRQIQACRNLELGEVVGDMTKMLRRVLGEDISLQSRLAPALPQVSADPSMMEQVLMNLVINARDAMPSGGRIIISVDAATFDERYVAAHPSARTGSFVCLKVSDTGSGIAPEIRSRIFEPFFTTKEVGKGTGLGLATVFGIVEEHHGWIEVESEVGSGTTFQVFLPALGKASVLTAASAGVSEVRRGTETILLVEDETTVRTIAAAALRQLGYRVLEAGIALDAIKRWDESQGKVDLLVTDIIMPGGLSGKQLAEQLRERLPTLKVVYATGYSTGTIGRQLQLEPGKNYLEKPYSFSDLTAIVGHCLDQK